MLLAILTIMLLNLGFKSSHEYFPDKKSILTANFLHYDNFFPIATLELANRGIKDKIHIMYVYFDPSIDHLKTFPNNDNIDVFTFKLTSEGKLHPTFDKSALIISDTHKKYFTEGQEKFKRAKLNSSTNSLIDFSDEPEWWQNDQTPLNSKGKPMSFICQVDINEVFSDDCRLFVFYDHDDKIVKYIYQRD